MSSLDFWNVHESRTTAGKKTTGERKFGNTLNKHKTESWILARELTPGEGMGEGGGGGNSRAGRDEYARVIFFLPRPLPVSSAHLSFLRLVAL